MSVEILPLSSADMPSVLKIDNESFDDAWSHEKFGLRLMPSNCVGMAAVMHDLVLGYMVYSFDEDHVRIMRLAVDSSFRRQGVGTAMLGGYGPVPAIAS
jgi:ribosomal protein S18 acetylase RimI-like enzyme